MDETDYSGIVKHIPFFKEELKKLKRSEEPIGIYLDELAKDCNVEYIEGDAESEDEVHIGFSDILSEHGLVTDLGTHKQDGKAILKIWNRVE